MMIQYSSGRGVRVQHCPAVSDNNLLIPSLPGIE